MRVAALYDIHGNLPAFEAVMADLRDAAVTHVVIGGDVFPGPMAGQVLDRLEDLEIPVLYLRGNGDREVLAYRQTGTTAVPERYAAGIKWNSAQLTQDQERRITRWPATLTMQIPGLGSVLFCHATPRNDVEIFTRRTPEAALLPVFAQVEESLIVCGHTHMQFDRLVGTRRVINAGSVGMPFGEPGAYWIVLGSSVELRRTHFDLQQAAAAIRATAYPGAADFAEQNVLAPPTEAAILATYSATEIKG
jgi:putative phosphoesterase